MKNRPTSGPCVRAAVLLGVFACSVGWAAPPPLSVDAQALAHWIHYVRLNANRQHADAAYIVVDGEQLRWWLLDGKGRVSGQPAAWPLLQGERVAAAQPMQTWRPPARD